MRDLRDRGRDVEGCIKQWFAFVKPNFEKVGSLSLAQVIFRSANVRAQYVEPQRKVANLIVPRGIENRVALGTTPPEARSIHADMFWQT